MAFDPKGKTFRHEKYEQYKAQREATPEDIRISVPIIKSIVEAYNIPVLEVPGYEADDVIGTLAHKAEKEGFEVFMLTSDKDYGQLVTDHVFMYRPRHTGGFEVMGPKEIREKHGLESHEQVVDLLGLMGDSSDNIPGCPGVGEKTAVKLLAEFGSIDNLLENTDKLKGALKTKVEENKELILFSRFLATIKTDVPIELNEEDLILEPANDEALKALFDKLEFRTLSARIWGNASQPTERKTTISKLEPAVQMSLFDTQQPVESQPAEPLPNLLSNTDSTPGMRSLQDEA